MLISVLAVAQDKNDVRPDAVRSVVLYLLGKKVELQMQQIDYGVFTADEQGGHFKWLVQYFKTGGKALVSSENIDNESRFQKPIFFYDRKKMALQG